MSNYLNEYHQTNNNFTTLNMLCHVDKSILFKLIDLAGSCEFYKLNCRVGGRWREADTWVVLCIVRLFWWRPIKLLIIVQLFKIWYLVWFQFLNSSIHWPNKSNIWFHTITIEDKWYCVVGAFLQPAMSWDWVSVDIFFLFLFFFISVSALLVFFS